MRLNLVLASLLVAATPAAASAHHSIAAVYDRDKAVSFSGKVTKFQFINPHSLIEVEFRGRDGRNQTWTLETSGPGGLERLGLTPQTLSVGDAVKAIAYPARSGGSEGWLTKLETTERTYDVGFRRNQPASPPPTPTQLN